MKKQNTPFGQALLLVAAVLALITISHSASAQKIGARFGTWEPRKCLDKTKPVTGAITAAQATQYLICFMEGADRENMYLVQDVSVTVGKGVPYNPKTYINAADIDVRYPTYPIRASYKQYQCGAASINPGKNCTLYVITNGTGVCYKTTFGDWNCSIGHPGESQQQDNVAPPQ